jgi:hypothetical protein
VPKKYYLSIMFVALINVIIDYGYTHENVYWIMAKKAYLECFYDKPQEKAQHL